MHLAHLKLSNFRAFKDLDLNLSPGPSIFVGDNAQGKTTILEAVYLLAIARAFRADNEREVVNWQAAAQQDQALVDATVEGEGGRTRIIIGYRASSTVSSVDGGGYSVRKEIRVGGLKRTATDLVGLLNVVLFSAEDIQLVQGSPATKRRYMDILGSQASSTYLKTLQRYQRILQQRNKLLKLLREGSAQEGEMRFWSGELAREGSWITRERARAMGSISDSARGILRELTEGREDLSLEYRPSAPSGDTGAEEETAFLAALTDSRRREIGQGSTVVGPHRDDFKLSVNGVDMGPYSSRGQARTLALTLRLAEASYLNAYKGGPVVLLDDVLSELDANRRKQVLDRVQAYGQTLTTTTDLEPFDDEFLAGANIYRVEDGTVTPFEDSPPTA